MSAVPNLGPANPGQPEQPEQPDDEGSPESKAGAAFGGIVGDAFQPQPPKGDDEPQFPSAPGFGTNPNPDGNKEEDYSNVLPDPPESVGPDLQGAPVDLESQAKADKEEGLPGGPVPGGAPHTYSPPPKEGEDVPDANAPIFPGSVESPPPPTAAELAEREAERRDMQEVARERRHETEGVYVPPISKFHEMQPGPPRPPTEDDLVRLERDIETLAKIIEEDDNYFGFGTGLNVAKAMHDRRVEELNHYRQIAAENGRAYALVQIWYDREREYAMLNTLFWLAIWAYGVAGIFRGIAGIFRLFGLGGGAGWRIPRTGQSIPPPRTSWGSGKTTSPAGSGKTRPFSQGGTWKAIGKNKEMNTGGVRPALPDPKTQRQHEEVKVRIEERAQRIDPQIKRMTEIRYRMEDLNAQRQRLPIEPRYDRDRARIDAELGRLTSERNKLAPDVQKGLAEQRADIDRAIDLKGRLYPTDPPGKTVQPTTPGMTKGQVDAALQEGPRIGGGQKTAVGGDTGTHTKPLPATGPTGTQIGPPGSPGGTTPPQSGGTSRRSGPVGFKQAIEEESALAETPAFWGYLGSLAFMDAVVDEDGGTVAAQASGFSLSQVAIAFAAVLALIFAGVVLGYSLFGGGSSASPSAPPTSVAGAPTPTSSSTPGTVVVPSASAVTTSAPADGAVLGVCARVVHEELEDFISYIAWDLYWEGVDVDHFEITVLGANDDDPFELLYADETGAFSGLSGLRGTGDKTVWSVVAVLTDGSAIDVTEDVIDLLDGPTFQVRFPQQDKFGDCL